MRLVLKDFQTENTDAFVQGLRRAARDARTGELQSVSLSSPTGSGKTVMVTAAIERILGGDETVGPDDQATFLWVTDQPELNEQTRRKMLEASSALTPSRLVVIDSSFDQEVFSPRTVYFLNIQKLGREKYLVTTGDKRTYTIWETVTNTVRTRSGSFFVFIDEAHRGMSENTAARNEATTIVQKFIKGSSGEIPSIPIVVGISATPERYDRLIADRGRATRSVVVKPDDVRASGLLKDTVTIYHPQEDQPSDMTMLREAARSWRNYCRQWAQYCDAQDELPVRPILVVQVQDGPGKQVSKTDIAEVIKSISDEVGPLPPSAFAHAFQEGSRIETNEYSLRYLAPSDIQADPDVQVILFKTSLNTGWDCPRAEVMMSFRTASDATLIAQLVGRMVRTPLARRIDADEHLNTVALYLPHYDETELTRVVNRLTTPDPDILPPVTIQRGEDVVQLQRASESDDAFDALAAIPTYVVPRSRKTSEVKRLMKLGRILANDEILPDGPEKAREKLLAVLCDEYDKVKDAEEFTTLVARQGKVRVRAVAWLVGTDQVDKLGETIELDASAENVDALFEAAGRKVGEGIHKAWWRQRVEQDLTSKMQAKLEFVALCLDPSALKRLEAVAQQTVQGWLKEYRFAIGKLPEGRQQDYNELRQLASQPELSSLTFPVSIEGKKEQRWWERHLYTDDRALYPASFNKWETKVIEAELAREDVVAWLRNTDRKDWALCVPYEIEGEWRALYPDFLAVRSAPGGLIVDILDPHLVELADAPAKAAGLAKYAAQHWSDFGRIELIILDKDDVVKRLDLTDETTREKVKGVQTTAHLRQLFEST